MTRAPELKSVNCTQCGAGLDVLGGGRVVAHVCPYCGSELDAQENYQVLRQFSDMPRPDSPFRLGMTGQIFDVDWTVIGTLGMREDWAGKSWTWAEHQLFSPTHGYAWLVVEDGHTTFSRRQRKACRPSWLTSASVEAADSRPWVRMSGERFQYYDTTTAQITFAEGEFTWHPDLTQQTVTISTKSDAAMLDFQTTANEREIYRTTYLDPTETAQAFGLDKGTLQPKGLHPLLPLRVGRHTGFVKFVGITFALVSLLLGLAFAALPGRTVLDPPVTVSLSALPQEVRFDVTDTQRLVRLTLETNLRNSWTYIGFEVLDPERETLFETGRNIEYYTGRDSEGTWSEGSTRANVKFRPTLPGTYTVVFSETESEIWTGGTGASQPSFVQLSAREGLSAGAFPILLAFAFGMVAGWHWLRLWWQRRRRWAGSDWTDED